MAAHKDTAEFSAQGIGRTIAAVVDGGLRAGMKILLGEEAGELDNGVEVPLLNVTMRGEGNIRATPSSVLGNKGKRGGALEIECRSIPLERVLGRWCEVFRI